jgi:phosphatidylglycerophosphatase A
MITLFTLMKWIVTLGPIGYMVAPGTMATLVTVPIACALLATVSLGWYLTIVIFFATIGFYCIYSVRNDFLHHDDPSEIVFDEFIGCLLTFTAVPCTTRAILMAIILFRFFDISKYAGVHWAEKLPGAWGIMADDILAALWAGMSVQVLLRYGILG